MGIIKEITEASKMDTRSFKWGIFTGFVLSGIGIFFAYPTSTIPKIEKVQSGYIAPSKLEITTKDLDKSDRKGLPETYIKVGEKSFVLRYDEQGSPTISPYKIKPLEIIINK